ncbi:uncharacterized protein LOC132637908 [Lycium barbarum]|uniref:uncharacterized protein LOC132637908 n=1 Tax=Lycium barbarum TaxID=112863 RepID=UPI00293E8814|nr:uncharacterized protein LOC132637908 [Lycium barbarum]
MWSLAPEFKEMVKEGWKTDRRGTRMYELVGKENKLKGADPTDAGLIDEENRLKQECGTLNKAREQFLRQKSKVMWLTRGDLNTKLYHSMLKTRRSKNRVFVVKDVQGQEQTEPGKVIEAFIEFYTNLLDEEVKKAMWEIKGDKTPGPDGYGSQFYKDSWDIVGVKVTKVVQDFFRMKPVLSTIISANQSAFVGGRTIVQNILICQDLVRLYKRKHNTQSCLLKIDLKKAYDTVEWDFVKEMLEALQFPEILLAGVLIRVGDMPGFEYHTKCKGLRLNHLYFADGMLLFCKGNYQSVMLLLRGFQTFSNTSGLQANAGKSNIFSSNMEKQCLDDICAVTGYQLGALPFRDLGVPVSSRKINAVDYEMLLDKMGARIRAWSSRNLTYAGRGQLINSVLLHVHTYWSSIFILPKEVMKRITALCRNFLWDRQEVSKRTPLMAWDLVCKPKQKGGGGGSVIWNEAAVAKYVWNVAQKADNLWVKWVDHVYIKDQDWWQYSPPTDCCWYWRKICTIKERYKTGYVENGWLKKDGKYTIQSGYKWRNEEMEPWPGSRWVWNQVNAPKHCFISWLAA